MKSITTVLTGDAFLLPGVALSQGYINCQLQRIQ